MSNLCLPFSKVFSDGVCYFVKVFMLSDDLISALVCYEILLIICIFLLTVAC